MAGSSLFIDRALLQTIYCCQSAECASESKMLLEAVERLWHMKLTNGTVYQFAAITLHNVIKAYLVIVV